MNRDNDQIDSIRLDLNQTKQPISNPSENTSFVTEMLERIKYLEYKVEKIEQKQD